MFYNFCAWKLQNFLNRQTFVASSLALFTYPAYPGPLPTPHPCQGIYCIWIHLENLARANNILHYNIFTFNLAASVPPLKPTPLPALLLFLLLLSLAMGCLPGCLEMSVPLTKCLISVQESKKLLYGLLIAGGPPLLKPMRRGLCCSRPPAIVSGGPRSHYASAYVSAVVVCKRSLNVVTYFVRWPSLWVGSSVLVLARQGRSRGVLRQGPVPCGLHVSIICLCAFSVTFNGNLNGNNYTQSQVIVKPRPLYTILPPLYTYLHPLLPTLLLFPAVKSMKLSQLY